MTYIENIYLCLALPLLLSLFFIRGRSRRYALFLVIGMTVCLLSAYVSSFFMGYYGADGTTAAIEITPVCEEGMKLLPLLFFYLIFEPAPQELPAAAIALAAGFATFENVCYLTDARCTATKTAAPAMCSRALTYSSRYHGPWR